MEKNDPVDIEATTGGHGSWIFVTSSNATVVSRAKPSAFGVSVELTRVTRVPKFSRALLSGWGYRSSSGTGPIGSPRAFSKSCIAARLTWSVATAVPLPSGFTCRTTVDARHPARAGCQNNPDGGSERSVHGQVLPKRVNGGDEANGFQKRSNEANGENGGIGKKRRPSRPASGRPLEGMRGAKTSQPHKPNGLSSRLACPPAAQSAARRMLPSVLSVGFVASFLKSVPSALLR